MDAAKHTPGALRVSFGGGVRLRAAVKAGSVVVGEMVRRPRTGWHEGSANAYRFTPNAVGERTGPRAVSEQPSIRDAIAKAEGCAT